MTFAKVALWPPAVFLAGIPRNGTRGDGQPFSTASRHGADTLWVDVDGISTGALRPSTSAPFKRTPLVARRSL